MTAPEQTIQESELSAPRSVAGKTAFSALIRESKWGPVTSLTVFMAAMLGLGFALLMPPFQFNDEHAHFARSYQISRGEFVGRPDSKIPAAVLASLLRYPEGFDPKSAPRTSFKDLFAGGAGDSDTSVQVENVQGLRFFSHGILASQVYWTACYLPASAGIRVARLLNMSPVAMLYAARLMNLLCFLAALAAALLLAPNFRAIMTALALMPMTLQQGVAVSADQLTISLSLVGFALVLHTREHQVSRRFLSMMFVVVPLWALCKNSLWALPLLLLIPGSQFKDKRRRAAFLLGVTLTTALGFVCWRALTSDAFAQYAAAELHKGVDFYANARLLAIHPVKIMLDLAMSPDQRVPDLFRQFVGTFGWGFNQLPLSLPYLEILFVVACIELSPRPFTIIERAILFLVFAAALIQTYAMLFVIDGTVRNGHYAFWAAGVQGRYLIPFCLAGFLALRQNAITVPTRVLAPVVLAASTGYGLLTLATINGFFYQ
jgi:uncharacterized membrane protein